MVTIPTIGFEVADGYSDNDYMDAHPDWAGLQIQGSGRARVDTHTAHQPGQVVDMSSGGAQLLTYQTPMATANHAVEADVFPDSMGGASDVNRVGLLLRGQSDGLVDQFGYVVRLQRDGDSPDESKLQIVVISPLIAEVSGVGDLPDASAYGGDPGDTYRTAGSGRIHVFDPSTPEWVEQPEHTTHSVTLGMAFVVIAETANLDATYSETLVHRLRGEIDGAIITAKLNGTTELTHDTTNDDVKYTTGNYVDFFLERLFGSNGTNAQLFIDNWSAEDIGAGAEVWIGSTGTLDLTATSDTFTPGAVTWASSSASIELTPLEGTFTPGEAIWAGESAPLALDASTGAFTGSAIWAGGVGNLELSPNEGAFTPGSATWAGTSANLEVNPLTGTFTPGAATWLGTNAAIELPPASGAFSAGGQIWLGETATLNLTPSEGAFSPGAVSWGGSQGLIEVNATSGVFVGLGGPQTWLGGDANLTLTPTLSPFDPGLTTWLGDAGLIDLNPIGGEFRSPWLGSSGQLTLTPVSGTFAPDLATWLGSIATLLVTPTSTGFIFDNSHTLIHGCVHLSIDSPTVTLTLESPVIGLSLSSAAITMALEEC